MHTQSSLKKNNMKMKETKNEWYEYDTIKCVTWYHDDPIMANEWKEMFNTISAASTRKTSNNSAQNQWDQHTNLIMHF